MKRHAGLQYGIVSGAQTDGALAPVRRIAQADGVAAAVTAAVKAVIVHGGSQRQGDIGGVVARLGHGQAVLDAFQQRRFGPHKVRGRASQEHGARQRRVIALVDPGNLEEGALALTKRRVVPGQVRGRRILAGGQHRHNGRIVTAKYLAGVIRPALDADAVDLGYQPALGQARLDDLENTRMHSFNDLRRHAHVLDFPGRFDQPAPVDQRVGIHEAGVGQPAQQTLVRLGGEIVVVHLHTHHAIVPAAIRKNRLGQIVHGVHVRVLDIVIRVIGDVFRIDPAGTQRAVGIHAPPIPHRLALEPDQYTLMDIKGPAVIAGQPGHVGGVADDQHINTPARHLGTDLAKTTGVLFAGKRQENLSHGTAHQTISSPNPAASVTLLPGHGRPYPSCFNPCKLS